MLSFQSLTMTFGVQLGEETKLREKIVHRQRHKAIVINVKKSFFSSYLIQYLNLNVLMYLNKTPSSFNLNFCCVSEK